MGILFGGLCCCGPLCAAAAGACGPAGGSVAPRMGGRSEDDEDAAGEGWPEWYALRSRSSRCCCARASARLRLAARMASGS